MGIHTDKGAAQLAATIQTFDDLPDAAQVRSAVFCKLLDCSRATLWRRVAAGSVPKPMREGPNVARWRVGDIRKHLAP
jgi:predicted DNA-binding transcriptional regulator AlpA